MSNDQFQSLINKLETLEGKIDDKIETLEGKIDNKIETLEDKIDKNHADTMRRFSNQELTLSNVLVAFSNMQGSLSTVQHTLSEFHAPINNDV